MIVETLPPGWAATTLAAFGELFCGQSLPAAKVNRDGIGTPYVTGPEQWDGQKVHLDKWTTEPARLAPDGCIFITVKGAGVGKLFPGVACAIGRDVYAYKPTSAIDRKFVELSLKFTIAEVVAEAKGDIPGLSKNHILDHTIPLPPLPEQKRIVAKIEELFSELEAGEASLRKARRQLGVYRQSLLKQAFEGKLTAPWRTQNPAKLESPESLLARIQSARESYYKEQLKDWEAAVKEWESVETDEKRPPKPQKVVPTEESIPVFDDEFPQAWATLNLSQFVLELGQGWSPKCEGHEAQGDEWSVIKTTAIQFGRFDASANKALPEGLPPRRWLALRAGDILITRAGPRSRCGVVCRVRADHPKLMLCDKAYRLVLSESATSSEFIERLLCSPAAMAAIEKLKTGINDSGVNITQSAFLQLALPIPPLPEQQEIVRKLDEQFESIERNERELDAALRRSEALRQAILKKAFTGRLVPQSPADEPASALLARLRAERAATPVSKRKPVRQS
ncbi:restriction endonuclease subunit S [Opitutales bacterium ASA1]|uniref:restriction endonuclease subunit S n=1 Tax=Congregicoccus parvus TaxID=3081749 RepID=UPI002B29855B|nr:restriction endonuclease subunit S [Opitutales bacterium ASA1]